MGYLVSWLEALPDVDEVQAVQPCSPGLLVRLMLHISSILGEHVFPTTSHDHLNVLDVMHELVGDVLAALAQGLWGHLVV